MNHLKFHCDPLTGQVDSVELYGQQLLDRDTPAGPELLVNDRPIPTRPHPMVHATSPITSADSVTLKGELFTNFWAGAGLAAKRIIGGRNNTTWPCMSIQYWIRREEGDIHQIPSHGPGGPMVEAPLWIDSLSVLNLNWKFWGDDTRMIFANAHSSGPDDQWGHGGYDNDSPERVKEMMKNPFRRTYPGTMLIHGGVFYNARTEHWLALTCRQAHVGYALNLDKAGRGVGYDFLLHSHFQLGQLLRLPDIVIYYGSTHQQMQRFLADYITFFYREPPEWVYKTHFINGLAWDNQPTWPQQLDHWAKQIDAGCFSGISYSLLTTRPMKSGTDPCSYQPDEYHGSLDDFKKMCHGLADKNVPVLVWMSHSGLIPGRHEIDDDWFIRGIDGKMVASWGDQFSGMCFSNPGHPGYIEYTKKWIRYYIKECRCKGIFFDCYGFIMPPDFHPRPFMRFPSDTNVLVLKFMREVYACVKECDPQAIVLGEGASLEGPIDVFSIHTNTRRAVDGMGPRDFLLTLPQWGGKRMVIDQGPMYQPGSGFSKSNFSRPEIDRFMTRFMRETGGRNASVALRGDISIQADYLFVGPPQYGVSSDNHATDNALRRIALPENWADIKTLRDQFSDQTYRRNGGNAFEHVPPGIYHMER